MISGLRTLGLKWTQGAVVNDGFKNDFWTVGQNKQIMSLTKICLNQDGLRFRDEIMDFISRVCPEAKITFTNDHSQDFSFDFSSATTVEGLTKDLASINIS